MIGLEGLQQAEALLAGAAGPAGDLAQELEGTLGGARVAVGETEIGIDDADQRHVREIVALGDELRADDDVGLALGDGFELQPQAPDAAQDVGGEHDGAGIGEMADDFFRDALDAGTAGNEMVEGAAFRAGIGTLLVVAAMVADELAAKAVLDQPARTVRALEAVAADAAERQRRIAAAVEEEQRLLAALQRVAHLRQQDRRQETAARGRSAAQVDRLESRAVPPRRNGPAARRVM